MAEASPPFGRMVLGLPHNALDYPAVEAAAELAASLGLPCLGAFIVEPSVFGIGEFAGAQELRSLAVGWQPIERAGLMRDIDDAVDAARRTLATVAGQLKVDTTFHLAHGATNEIVASLARRDDILVMIEPRHPADRITRQFLSLVDAAFDVSSSVMLLPSRVARKHGPIAVLASGPGDDATIETAATIARATRESLILINATGERIPVSALADEKQVSVRVVSVSGRRAPPAELIASGLAGIQERLIIARRTKLDGAQSRSVADKRGVPVLLAGSKERAG